MMPGTLSAEAEGHEELSYRKIYGFREYQAIFLIAITLIRLKWDSGHLY